MIEAARTSGTIRGPLNVMTMTSLLVAILALGSSQWVGKSALWQPIIDVMPKLTGFPGAEGGFNPNEIAGVLAWLAPLMIGIALYRWQNRETRWDVTAAAVLLSVALILGQSRSAIIGVLSVLLVGLPLMVQGLRWRVLAYVGLAAVIVLQIAASTTFAQMEVKRVAPTRTEISAVPWQQTYDELNVNARLQIWGSALAIVRDYPLTGVGMAMFRDGRVRAEYPVAMMPNSIIPHAHNDLLQVASDMGIPGLIVFLGMYAAVGYMLFKAWRLGDAQAKAVSVATAAGLLAHAIYGFGDAITLWDRFFFPLWMLFGLAGAQYVLVTQVTDSIESKTTTTNHETESRKGSDQN
jgi:O-antigen ligase